MLFTGLGQVAAQTPNDDVMIQGFNWESKSNVSGWWNVVSAKAPELGAAQIDAIWLPPSSNAGAPEGYLPRELYSLTSSYGTQAQLQSCISAMHGQGIKVLADIVINHRVGCTGWTDFCNPTFGGCAAICGNDEAANAGHTPNPCGDNDTGEGYAAARDVNHLNATVRQEIKDWMNWLKNTIGYDGWRYDFVKGFGANFVGEYNTATSPYISVGEYWDGSTGAVSGWVTGTGNSTAFDFPLKYVLHDAIGNGNYAALNVGGTPGLIGWNSAKAVTFLDNHDTGSTQAISPFPTGNNGVMQGYAYILTHPGIPMIFWDHYFDWGADMKTRINELVTIRKANGITATSAMNIQTAGNGVYAATITGSNGQVAMKIGGGAWSPSGTGWVLKASGTNYAVWDKLSATCTPLATITPASGNYTAPLSVSIAGAASCSGSSIYYTTDGSTPTTSSSVYTAPLSVSTASTVCAIEVNGASQSAPSCASYTFNPTTAITVHFYKPTDWAAANIYFWGSTPAGTANTWPGVAMTQECASENWYSYTFPSTVTSINVVFNQGDNIKQTVDIIAVTSETWYKLDPTDTSNKYEVITYSSNPGPSCSTTPPSAPTTLAATANGTTINLTWADNSSDETSFVLQRSLTSGSGFADVATIAANTTSYADTGLSPNTTYYYRIKAVNGSGSSAWSNEANATTGDAAPALTVHFYKPAAWGAAYIHFWGATPTGAVASTTWPGYAMTPEGDATCSWYSYTFPVGVDCVNIVFNANTSPQTADLLNVCSEQWYKDGAWSSSNPGPACASPAPTLTITPGSTNFSCSQTVNLTATTGATIYYTTDGSTPTTSSASATTSTSLTFTTTTTLKAFAQLSGVSSTVQTETYTLVPPSAVSLTVNPAGPRTFAPSQTVNLTTTNPSCTGGAVTIYYTTDGSTPTTSSASASNTLTLTFTATTTLKAFAKDASGNMTAVQTHVYTLDTNNCGPSGDGFTWDNATVYFVVTDRFYDGNSSNNASYGRTSDVVGGFHGGDLQGLTQKVNAGYFDSLGVTAIWITPPYEQIHGYVPGWGGVPEFQKHYAYHGYYALDFTEIDANMGTAADFGNFVDAAHNHGIRVVMDIVMNHVGYDNAGDTAEFGLDPDNDGAIECASWWGSDWIRKDSDGIDCAPCGGGDLTSCLAGLPDVISESTATVGLPPILQTKWNATKEAQETAELNTFFTNSGLPRTPINHIVKWLTDWVREYGVDGFRLDTYKHIELARWGTLKDQATIALAEWKANNPSKALDDLPFWMVGENYGSGPAKWNDAVNIGKTDALINFSYQGQGGNFATADGIFANYAAIANPDPEWNFLSYLSSHDTQLSDRSTLINQGTTFLMLPGAVQIFYGDESKRMPGPGPGDQPTRSDMNWGSIDNSVLSHWKKLGQFRKLHPSIGAGSHTKISSSPYAFKREVSNADVQDLVVVAMGVSGATTINVSGIWPNGKQLRDYYTGATATVTGGNITFTANSNGVILIEDPNPTIVPSIVMTPENNAYNATGHSVCIQASSLDCEPVTTYYSMNPNADPNNLSEWTAYTGCLNITTNSSVTALAVNNTTGEYNTLTQNYWIEVPDMTIYYDNSTTNWATVNLYYWACEPVSAGNTALAWPGAVMTKTNPSDPNCKWYQYTLPASLACNVIFSCGSNACQTGDLSTGGGTSYYSGGAWSSTPPVGFCSALPTAPTTLAATATGSSTIDLTWTDNSSNETGFIIQQSTSPSGPFTTIATTGANTTSYTVTGLSASTTYYYQVIATNGGGSSSASNVDNATTDGAGCEIALNVTNTGSYVTPNTYQAAQTITSAGTVNAGATVTFQAGTSVTLTAGFHAMAGSTFTARIAACTPFAEGPVASRNAETTSSASMEKMKVEVIPNPMRDVALVRYYLPAESRVQIALYDLSGRVVRTLPQQLQAAGWQETQVASTGLAKGIYFLNVSTQSETMVKKVVIME
jgi:alpha-amylase